MSDYLWNAGYDAGAVVDMNNLAIGYFPRGAALMQSGPIQAQPGAVAQPGVPQPAPQPQTAEANSETSS